MKKYSLFWVMLVGLLVPAIGASPSMAAVFHVTNATEFKDALKTAENNGEDDTIYLAAGTYQGSFRYRPSDTEHKGLAITGEPGTISREIILDGQGSQGVLSLYDDDSTGLLVDININGITIQNGLGGDGAGLRARFLQPSANVSITNCIIRNNSGRGYGAGIVIEGFPGGNVALENNLILNNTVTERYDGRSNGGGVAILSGSVQTTIRNNIVANNSASGITAPHGGGLFIQSGTIYLIGNTIYNNEANKGGGVYFSYAITANVYNNIIYGNTATEGGDIYFETVTNRNGYNNDWTDVYGAWTNSGSNLNTDPLFVDAANNDFHVEPTSPMVDTGTAAVPDPPGLPVTDFAGNPRVFGTAPDIGALETCPVYPKDGTTGTKMILMGSGYGSKKGKVLLGNAALTVSKWTEDSIQCQLPKALSPDTYNVTIRPQAKGSTPLTIPNGFTVKTPEIDSVEPNSGSEGDEITINGYYFGTKKGKVKLGTKTCKVLSWTMVPTTGESKIRFLVPKGLSSGAQQLTVTNGVGANITNFTVTAD